jgi:anti-anti-sigma regulatory factor
MAAEAVHSGKLNENCFLTPTGLLMEGDFTHNPSMSEMAMFQQSPRETKGRAIHCLLAQISHLPCSADFPNPLPKVHIPPPPPYVSRSTYRTENQSRSPFGMPFALRTTEYVQEEVMVGIHIDNFGDLAVVECEGRIVSSDAAFALRNAVTSQTDARMVVLDLSEVDAIGGGGVGMLAFLQRWAEAHDVRLKLFNPSRSLRQRLDQTTSIPAFEFATIDELIAYFPGGDSRGTVVPLDPLGAAREAHAG